MTQRVAQRSGFGPYRGGERAGSRWRRAAAMLAALAWLAACASPPPDLGQSTDEIPAMAFARELGVTDGRGRFREIYCAVLESHGKELPDYRPCEEALTLVGDEGGATGKPVVLGSTSSDFLVLMVPGLGWECFEEWLDYAGSGPRHVGRYGFEARGLRVDGLSGVETNARQIRDFIVSLPEEYSQRPIVLTGYSKGTPDVLEAVVSYPEVAERVVAVVSLAGSVGGSLLADDATQDQANILIHVPGSECDKGDEGAVASLRPDVRKRWLAENPLPRHIRYYSVVTYPDPDNISWGLRNTYRFLAGVDARNDTQVLIYDQMIPGSTLLAFANADHWAIAVPVARTHPFIGSTFVNHNDYPREALLESVLRYVEEDLGGL